MKNAVAPHQLRCEHRKNPLGLGETRPGFSWILADGRRGAVQSACQVLVASTLDLLSRDEADLWDSGKEATDRSIHFPYGGPTPASGQRCFWKVRVWDGADQPSPWSEAAWWEMGLSGKIDWQAGWIRLAPGDRDRGGQACAFLRKPFALDGTPRRARIHASALGCYTLYINGRRVGQDYFTPGWTEYRKRVQYQTYDVTQALVRGENVVGALLGDGWYCGHIGLTGPKIYGDRPELLVQLEIEYEDGAAEKVVTDRSWRGALGPLISSDMLMGETYDARLELPGWCEAGFDDGDWSGVEAMKRDKPALFAQQGPTVQQAMELKTQAVTEAAPGCHVFDLGQNMAGWVRLEVKGDRGQEVTLRFGEMLDGDGRIYTENLRKADCTDRYILKGRGVERYEPHFTYHGFRYVEVTGYPGNPGPEAITGIVVHSAAPVSGSFTCSSAMLNQLQKNIVWSQRGNFMDVPTDCPQRDERLGWLGDAQIFMPTACFNMNTATFFQKWFQDVVDAQREDGAFTHVAPDVIPEAGVAGWGDAGVICPWIHYLCYGDGRILARHYPAMAKWITYLERGAKKLIRPAEGFGDWVALGADTAKELIATAYFARSTRLMSRMAKVLGKEEDGDRYGRLFNRIKRAFCRAFVTEEGRVRGDTQTGYVLALHFDLLPMKKRKAAAGFLEALLEKNNFHLSTGFLGTGHLLHALAKEGRFETAFKLLTNTTYPSWGYPIGQGATTIWERWDGWTEERGFQDPEMNSFNHYAFGAVGAWLYEKVAGIEPDPEAPGYKGFFIQPRPGGGLTSARGVYDSIHGRIISDWKWEGGIFRLAVVIPPNTEATVFLPADSMKGATESGTPLRQAEGVVRARAGKGRIIIEAGAGEYFFASSLA